MDVFSNILPIIVMIYSVIFVLSLFFQKKISKRTDVVLRVIFAVLMLLLGISVWI